MGGAVGGAPTSTGQQSAPQMGALGPAQGPAQGAMPMGGGLPMAGGGGGELFAPRVEAQQVPQQMQAPQQIQAPQQMQQQMYRPQMQQQMYRPQALQSQGLQMLLSRMMNSYQQPQRALPPPQYQNRALAYRPNMASAQQALGRTATSQAEAQAAAAAKAAKAADEQDFLNWQRQMYEAQKLARDNPYSGGGG